MIALSVRRLSLPQSILAGNARDDLRPRCAPNLEIEPHCRHLSLAVGTLGLRIGGPPFALQYVSPFGQGGAAPQSKQITGEWLVQPRNNSKFSLLGLWKISHSSPAESIRGGDCGTAEHAAGDRQRRFGCDPSRAYGLKGNSGPRGRTDGLEPDSNGKGMRDRPADAFEGPIGSQRQREHRSAASMADPSRMQNRNHC